MADTPVKIVVDLSKPKGERETIVPLTEAEIAEREAQAVEAEAQRVADEAAAQALADLKASAKAKLVSGQPLTEEEAATLVF
jgi:regulator of protease activity HflC (stomatin/prohibitin superfamily)